MLARAMHSGFASRGGEGGRSDQIAVHLLKEEGEKGKRLEKSNGVPLPHLQRHISI